MGVMMPKAMRNGPTFRRSPSRAGREAHLQDEERKRALEAALEEGLHLLVAGVAHEIPDEHAADEQHHRAAGENLVEHIPELSGRLG